MYCMRLYKASGTRYTLTGMVCVLYSVQYVFHTFIQVRCCITERKIGMTLCVNKYEVTPNFFQKGHLSVKNFI